MANPAEPHIQSLAIALAGFGEVILHYTPLNSQSQASSTHLRFSSSPLVSAPVAQRADRQESAPGPASGSTQTQADPAPNSQPPDRPPQPHSAPAPAPDDASFPGHAPASTLAPAPSRPAPSSLASPARRSASCTPEMPPDSQGHPRSPQDTPPRARTPASNHKPVLSATEPSSPVPFQTARRRASLVPETQPNRYAHPRSPRDASPPARNPTANPAPARSVTEPSSPAPSQRSASCVPETQPDSYPAASEPFSFELDKLARLKRPLDLSPTMQELLEEADTDARLAGDASHLPKRRHIEKPGSQVPSAPYFGIGWRTPPRRATEYFTEPREYSP
ncbi:hypothetical protein FA95DRAFT_1612516 [Auriscalpium vulgare]|uniref:Uncharacterized protein n=1 Tax=Auriscalpium vulgare TaxID=40419 RepID=A0ACB8R5T7_9AGAM|nr:hypothetical protein FA95DRAFT_1612516 [Auriscalpium vulgare]